MIFNEYMSEYMICFRTTKISLVRYSNSAFECQTMLGFAKLSYTDHIKFAGHDTSLCHLHPHED